MEKSEEPTRKNQPIDINININVQNPRNGYEKSTTFLPEVQKIKSNLSVSQLAFFYRLLHDQGSLSVVNQTNILKFIAVNFYTDNAQEISERSLRSKYYNIDPATKESVKAILNKMLSAIDKY